MGISKDVQFAVERIGVSACAETPNIFYLPHWFQSRSLAFVGQSSPRDSNPVMIDDAH